MKAIKILTRSKQSGALLALAHALKDEDNSDNLDLATQILEKIKSTDLSVHLVIAKILSNPDEDTRLAAVRALEAIKFNGPRYSSRPPPILHHTLLKRIIDKHEVHVA
jgi:hypothetical protein